MIDAHPLADLFPMMGDADLAALAAHIADHGLLEAIMLAPDGRILDGRHRYRACLNVGVEPVFETYCGPPETMANYVIGKNLERRHLNESQRAMVAARLASLPRGANQHSPIGEPTQAEAAVRLNVGKRSVERAREVLDDGAPELAQAVDGGVVSVSAAADLATLPKEEQVELIARGEREILAKAKEIRAGKQLAKRAQRLQQISSQVLDPAGFPKGAYPVVYADPPWRFDAYSDVTGIDRSAENHYPTMALDEIMAMPVPAADDAVLFLWATSPMLPEALRVMAAWGFAYKSQVIWVKDRIGTGYWTRNKHEILLIGTRGDIPAPIMGMQPVSVQEAPVGRHSAKPDLFANMIADIYPTLPRIELFNRGGRDGWEIWGNQAMAG